MYDIGFYLTNCIICDNIFCTIERGIILKEKTYKIIRNEKLKDLTKHYKKYEKYTIDKYSHIFESVISGIFAVILTTPSINAIINPEVLKNNIAQYISFGIIVPAMLYTNMILKIKKMIEDNKIIDRELNYLEDNRDGISYDEIEASANKKIEEEIDEMFERNKVQIIKKVRKVTLGD